MHINLNASSKQDGFTLLEILVTIIILAIGLLGIASLQNTAVKFSYDSYLRSQASILSYDLMDRSRSNIGITYTLTNGVAPATPTPVTCIGDDSVDCDPTEIANADLLEWYNHALTVFPDGLFALSSATVNNNLNYTLTISWEDRYENDAKTGENQRAEFSYNFDVRGT